MLGSLVRDLSPFDYQPPDGRYDELLGNVQAIFDAQRAHEVDVQQRIAAADALGQAGDPRIDPRATDYWIHVPAGTFWMGAQKTDPDGRNYDEEALDEGCGRSEEPVHEVELDEFWIARYPVTVRQFQQFVDADGYHDRRWWSAGGFGQLESPRNWDEQIQFPTRPVYSVSWYEAVAFCAWMADWRPGVRLPTEAEWERAARGGVGRKFPWGDEPTDEHRLDYERNIGHVTPVGIYPAGNTLDGISDMAGNVWEWCQDWFAGDYYAHSEPSNPAGPEKGDYRVLRGGAWNYLSHLCRAAFRLRDLPDSRNFNVGFRVLCLLQNSS